jgi:ribosomal protein S18 acetylase RimI-like enzyme
MAKPDRRYTLKLTQSAEEWAAYHTIRRDSIFAVLLPAQRYDENHPDEFKPGNLPHVLWSNDEIVGAVRIDIIDDIQAALRLIAIRKDLQRRGHGAMLLKLAEQAVFASERTEVVINAHPTSLNFYLANGYVEGDWLDVGPVPAGLIRVGKHLSRR